MIKEYSSFSRNDTQICEKQDPLSAVNPFFACDEQWTRSRSALVPIFSTSKIKSIYPSMEYACTNFVNFLKAQAIGEDFDAKSVHILVYRFQF